MSGLQYSPYKGQLLQREASMGLAACLRHCAIGSFAADRLCMPDSVQRNQRESPSHSTASSSLTSSVLVSKDMPQNVAQNGSC